MKAGVLALIAEHNLQALDFGARGVEFLGLLAEPRPQRRGSVVLGLEATEAREDLVAVHLEAPDLAAGEVALGLGEVDCLGGEREGEVARRIVGERLVLEPRDENGELVDFGRGVGELGCRSDEEPLSLGELGAEIDDEFVARDFLAGGDTALAGVHRGPPRVDASLSTTLTCRLPHFWQRPFATSKLRQPGIQHRRRSGEAAAAVLLSLWYPLIG